MLEHLGYAFSRPKMRQLCAVLGDVDRDAEARGEPELAVLVVRQSDGIPGQGWWVERAVVRPARLRMSGDICTRSRRRPFARLRRALEGPEAARFIREVQAETFAFWQSGNGTGPRRGGR